MRVWRTRAAGGGRAIAALELIDGRAATLAAEHLDLPAPLADEWMLLIELASDLDPTEHLANALAGLPVHGQPAVAVDTAGQQRLWRLRESMAEVVGLFGPPVKFDIALPLAAIPAFAAESAELLGRCAGNAIPILFGHIGEGNNVSSEHGVGSRKRGYLAMSRQPADIAAMRTIKSALDPTGYLNPAVLFD